MTVTRRAAAAVAALCATTMVLAGCGGSDEEPLVKPTSDTTTSAAAPDQDGFTPAQREVSDAVQTYVTAFFGRGASPVQPAIASMVTPDLLAKIVPAETKAIDDAGLQYIGEVTLDPQKVTIDGDTATYQGCRGGGSAAVVKKGETGAGVGSRPVTTSQLTYGLVRVDGRWLINDPRGERVSTCAP